jgi:POT family proton-dependent oligopeptide transporter
VVLADGSLNMIRDIHAFKYGFLAAGIAMIIGTAIFYFLKNKYVVSPEGKPIGGLPSGHDSADYEEGESMKAEFSTRAIMTALAIFAAVFFAFNFFTDGDNVVKLYIYPFIYASGVALATLILLDTTLTKIETQRIWVIYIMSFFIIFFWAAFEQAGSSLTFIADNQTDRDIFGWNMPPSMVQIFNGLFVVMLAFPFSMLWDKLREKNIEPLSTVKQSIGLLLIAVSYFIIANNVKDLGNSGLLAIKWLILLYLIQTVAELCLSPIGLSLVGKLAPKRFASLAYGVFFISSAAGYALSGTLGSILPATGDKFKKASELGIDLQGVLDKTSSPTAEQLKLLADNQINDHYKSFAGFEIQNLYDFFMVFVVLCGIAALILFLLTPKIKKMMHGIR